LSGGFSIVERILAHARSAPDKIAVVYNGEAFSYVWLARRISARRREFERQGFEPGGVAVLHLRCNLDAWIVSLALRSLGLTTLALRSLEDLAVIGPLGVACLVTTADLGPAPAGLATVLVPAGWYAADLAGEAVWSGEASCAFGGHILLTSGTTGGFKKFAVGPAADAINIASHVEIAGLTERTVMNLFNFGLWTSAGYYVAASVWTAGGCVVIDQGRDAATSLFARAVTDAWMTPFILAQQLAAAGERVRRRDDVRLIVGGAALSRALAEEVLDKVTRRLCILIAATETGPWSLDPVRAPEDIVWRRVHPSRRVEIVDEDDRPLPAGRLGLVRIRVIDGASGYLGDAAVSRTFFRDGCFYPGDLAVAAPDGRIALQGRATEVIHVDGGKVATGPIERALRDRLGVDEVCVFCAPDDQARETLHVVLQTRRAISREDLAAAARADLRGFPAACFHRLEALPRNASGKVQRAVLRTQILGAATPPPTAEAEASRNQR
jgi:acyl-CoA synthetase (AMP-forming)/AMP-acid ligase II